MLTDAADRSLPLDLADCGGVTSRRKLAELGFDSRAVAAQVAARRWSTFGRAVLLANSAPTQWQQRRICLFNCGTQALLTSFTCAEEWGLRRWERRETHVIVPAGSRHPKIAGLVLHRTADWDSVGAVWGRHLHDIAASLLLAASSFRDARSATGMIAAGVQQRLVHPDQLRRALEASPRLRHRRALLLAVADIAQGAEALSEIDLGKLCQRYGLPAPRRQVVRVEPNGRRRYLDAEWDLPDGRTLAAEIDGAHHLDISSWQADQVRQNEIVIGGTTVLRFPSSMVRNSPQLVADQLRRAMGRS